MFALWNSCGYYIGSLQELLLKPHIQSVIRSAAGLVAAHVASQSGRVCEQTARVEGAASKHCGACKYRRRVVCGVGTYSLTSCQRCVFAVDKVIVGSGCRRTRSTFTKGGVKGKVQQIFKYYPHATFCYFNGTGDIFFQVTVLEFHRRRQTVPIFWTLGRALRADVFY